MHAASSFVKPETFKKRPQEGVYESRVILAKNGDVFQNTQEEQACVQQRNLSDAAGFARSRFQIIRN